LDITTEGNIETQITGQHETHFKKIRGWIKCFRRVSTSHDAPYIKIRSGNLHYLCDDDEKCHQPS